MKLTTFAGTAFEPALQTNSRSQKRRARRSLSAAVLGLSPLEPRVMLTTLTATTFAGPLITNSVYNYEDLFFGQNEGTVTTTVIGPASFNSQGVTEVDTNQSSVTTQNFNGFDASGNYVTFGSINRSTITTVSGTGGILFPAQLTAGQTFNSNYTQTAVTGAISEPETISDSFSLGNTTSVTVPAGTFSVTEVDDSQVQTTGSGSHPVSFQYFISPTVGLVEYIETSGQSAFGADSESFELSTATGLGSLLQTPTQLAFTQLPSTVAANATLGDVVVHVEDANGTVVTTNDTDVTLTLNGANGTLGGTVTEQAVSGVATFSDLTISAAGNYTLTATDGALANATSSNIHVTGGAASGGSSDLSISITKDTLPSSVVAGATSKGAVTVNLVNSGNGTSTGDIVKIFASTDGTTNNAILLGTAPKAVTVKAHVHAPVTVQIKSLPSTLNGNYTLIATVTDAGGNITDSPAGPTLTAAAPFISFAETITAISGLTTSTPTVSGEATKAAIKLSIKNNGNVESSGNTTIAVFASPDQTTANGTLIRSESLPLAVKNGKSQPETFKLENLPTLANGNYFLVLKVTDANGDVTTLPSPVSFPVHAPFEQLVPVSAVLKTSHNGTGNLTFTVTNEGNIASSGTNTATVTIPGGAVVGQEPSSIILKPGKPQHFTAALPADKVTELQTAGTATLTITDANGANQTLTFTT